MPENFPTKLVVGLVVAVVAGVGAYLYFGTGSTAPNDSLQTSGSGNPPDDAMTSETEEVDTDLILAQLTRLKNIKIDTDVFDSDAFLSLRDISVTISDQPVGRENPFIPSDFTQQGSSVSPNLNTVNQRPLDIFDEDEEDDDVDQQEAATATPEEAADESSDTADADNEAVAEDDATTTDTTEDTDNQ